ncbi:hypothetical protein Egran_03036 [Elaphomyces granulatus]|uniref:Uncharacterized protein n=1 Tax=Elaphomyces granulatus TaxID=519963 RepID=A0A232LYF1_9EURO|nr:hypothetical protein Egran_03036 [Elaphomyces granulatus]
MYRFLGWCLKLTRGTDNRRLKEIRKSSTLETDWKTFCGYYEMVTKIRIDGNTNKEVCRGLKFLINEHSLDTQERKRTPVYIEDMIPFNETILSTQEKRFWLGF